MYRKLKRVWSHNDMNYIPKFKEVFPELRGVSSEELCNRWIELGIDFYSQEPTPVSKWVRFTLPFAIILMLLMFLALPFVFLFTGKWGYSLGKHNRVLNWFKALKLQ
jgi:hypothetical protein